MESQGKYEEALAYLLKSKEISEEVSNSFHFISIYSSIGLMLSRVGKYEESYTYYLKCKSISEQTLPDRQLAILYSNLGALLINMGKIKESLFYFLKSKDIWELHLLHDDLAISYKNIAIFYCYEGKLKESEEYFSKSKKIYKNSLNYLDLSVIYKNLSFIFTLKNDLNKSLNYLKKCKKIRKINLHANHPDLLTTYVNLLILFFNRGEFEKFSNLKWKSRFEQILNSDDLNLVVLHHHIIFILKKVGCSEESLMSHIKNRCIWEQILSIHNLDLGKNSGNDKTSKADDKVHIKNFKKKGLSRLENQKNAENEYKLLSKLAKYKKYFLEPYSLENNSKKPLIKMEKAKFDLFEMKKNIITGNYKFFNERNIILMLQQIIEAYAILKKEKIVHSDVHPGNILIGFDNYIKLCDFEFSTQYSEEINETTGAFIKPNCNQFEYFLAPELLFWREKLSSKQEKIIYDPFKSDIFSVGLCILFLIHPELKDPFAMKGFNNYNFDIDQEEIQTRNEKIYKFYKLGEEEFELKHIYQYNDYIKYEERLQNKINSQIKSIPKCNFIKSILRKMLKVNFHHRKNIKWLLERIKLKNFNID